MVLRWFSGVFQGKWWFLDDFLGDFWEEVVRWWCLVIFFLRKKQVLLGCLFDRLQSGRDESGGGEVERAVESEGREGDEVVVVEKGGGAKVEDEGMGWFVSGGLVVFGLMFWGKTCFGKWCF